MSYLYKQKLNLMELVPVVPAKKTILIFEPEEYLLALYSGYLTNHEFVVRPCTEAEELELKIGEHDPDLLMFNTQIFQEILEIKRILQSLKKQYPELPIVTISHNLDSNLIKELMNEGISSHIERKLTRPKDIVFVAKTVLNLK